METKADIGRAALLTAAKKAGFQAKWLAHREPKARAAHLLDVEGFVGDDDKRLVALKAAPRVAGATIIGGYPVPLPKR